ncbi:MAG: protein jag [Clostridia bacterium]|nr:protein jag [Clostridia bacterium]
MKTIEASGKTVEEALSAGLKQLGCDLSQVTHEVIDRGSPGLFGMFGRLARVKITVKEEPREEDEFSTEMPVISLSPDQPARKGKKDAPKEDKPANAPKAEKKPKKEAPKAESETEKPEAQSEEKAPAAEAPAKAPKQRRERPKKEKKEKQPAPAASAAEAETAVQLTPVREFPPLDVEKLGEDGKKAYEFISNITRLMNVEVEIRLLEEENQVFVDITGDTLGVLIGRRGDTLDAVQYLTSLYVNRDKSEYTRVTIDVEHYRAKREETLVRLANRMANRARKSGRRVVLEPMNPYERRVLHSALQNDPYVQTHSEGEDPYRRVIITLK